NLLFGFLALQNNLISREDLIAAVSGWLVDKNRPLSEVFRQRRLLADDEFPILEALVAKQLARHGNDAEKSLAALATVAPPCEELKQLGDADIVASLVHVSLDHRDADPHLAKTLSVDLSKSSSSRYRIMRPHAKGGLGQVFLAKDMELNRDVALKEI